MPSCQHLAARILSRATALGLGALILAATAVRAQAGGEWSAYTSMTDVHAVLPQPDAVWAITSGGVLRYDPAARTCQRFTRLDGLAGNLITSAAADSAGDLWFGTNHQGLSRYRTQTGVFGPPFREFEQRTVQALLARGNQLLVGTDRGISTFLIDKEEVKENYRQLGNLPKDSGVRALIFYAHRLWAGTDIGIASADLSSPNLQDPDNWISMRTGAVRAFLVHADTLFCATNFGIWMVAGPRQRLEPDRIGLKCVALAVYQDTLYAVDDDGGLWIRKGAQQWEEQPGVAWRVNTVASSDTTLWLGTPYGLRVLAGAQPPPMRDPAANYFHEMTKTPDGDLWIATVPKDNIPPEGVYEFDGENWNVYNTSNGLPSNAAGDVATDLLGQVWVGTWGKGLAIRDTTGAWHTLDQTNSPLHGCCGGNRYVVITDIQRDAQGLMWVGNIHVGLLVMDGFPATRTLLYDQETIGLGELRDMGEFAIAPDGLKWITTPLDGLVLFDDGGTPFLAGDEYSQVFNTLTESRLSSNRTSAVLIDQQGRVWVATDNGLDRITGTYNRPLHSFHVEDWRVYNTANGLPANSVTALAQDSRGNIWVGTESGMAEIDAGTGSVAFTLNTNNSGLIDDRVNSLFFDADAGDLWIGTLNGLSRLHVAQGGTNRITGPSVYPNPLILGRQATHITFTDLPLGAAVDIFALNGQQVAHVPGTPGQGTLIWNAVNEAGYLVSSGIYLYLASDDAGHTVRGQFAVVHAR